MALSRSQVAAHTSCPVPSEPAGSLQPKLLPYPFQHFLHVVAELHEQVDFPAGVTIDRVHLRSKRARSRPRDEEKKIKKGKKKGKNPSCTSLQPALSASS